MNFVRSILTGLLLTSCLAAHCVNLDDYFEKKTYNAQNGIMIKYRLLRPDVSQSSLSQYPLIVFLHGSGERGDDNRHQLDNGGALFVTDSIRTAYPAYVIFPQCPDHDFWSYRSAPKKPGPDGLRAEKKELPLMCALMELIDSYKNRPEVDSSRIYLVGLSMGGMAVYDILCRHPEEFAAAETICGAVDPRRLVNMKDVPLRIFHGKRDEVVPIIASEIVYSTLKSMGAEVELVEFKDDDHNSWDSAFEYPDFIPWLFKHSLLAPTLSYYSN